MNRRRNLYPGVRRDGDPIANASIILYGEARKDPKGAVEPFSEFTLRTLGPKWVIAPCLTDALKEKGYERAITQKQYQELRSRWQAQQIEVLAAAFGAKLARHVFEQRGNHTEAHLSEAELSALLGMAFGEGMKRR